MTITDIARMANVSKATVSRVINNKPQGVSASTRERIKRIIEEAGYVPNPVARGIVVPESKTVGIIIPDITNPFFPQLVKGIEDEAVKNGYAVLLCNSDGSRAKEERYIASLIGKSVDGVILTSSASHTNTDNIEFLVKNSNIPVVLLDRTIRGVPYAGAILVNNESGGYEGTNFFIRNGHKNIVFLSGPENLNTAVERAQGYRNAMLKAGLTPMILSGQFTAHSGYAMALDMLEKYPDTTAVFASNDVIALGCMRALMQRKIAIPEQIEVLGFDDIDMCELVTPTLSTMSQSAYDIGSQAMTLIIDALTNSGSRKRTIMIDAKLILRESTKNAEDCG